MGYGEYDQDDREADKVWDDIDEHMDQRRRVTREKRLKEELEEMRKKNPKITETFADLKRELAETMTQADWEVLRCAQLLATRTASPFAFSCKCVAPLQCDQSPSAKAFTD